MMRQLATVRLIDAIKPIDGMNAIETAVLGGWEVIVVKGKHAVGEKVVYFEIDSWIPHDLAPFLCRGGRAPCVFRGVEGARLRTVKMHGQISQGLVLPVPSAYADAQVGDDLTDRLGVLKWATVDGGTPYRSGSFPDFVHKSHQRRIQNMNFRRLQEADTTWEVTEKLDGSSFTCFKFGGTFGVCSHNHLILRDDETSPHWRAARAADLERIVPDKYAFQGELIGPKIRGNRYQLASPTFYLYDVFDIEKGAFLSPSNRRELLAGLDHPVLHVPILDKAARLTTTMADLIAQADGPAFAGGRIREGLVWKCNETSESFKVISNRYLLNE